MTRWAETAFSAARREAYYGRRWDAYIARVSVSPPPGGSIDAEAFRDDLAQAAKGVSGKCLDDVLPKPTMEEMARWFATECGKRHNVVEVTISGPEGMGCQLWWRD